MDAFNKWFSPVVISPSLHTIVKFTFKHVRISVQQKNKPLKLKQNEVLVREGLKTQENGIVGFI